MIAIPVLVGSLGRIPLGILTDRFGGRAVFAAVSFFTILPVTALAFSDTYLALLAAGIFLGTGGAVFAVGIPYINLWFPPEKRGLALGVYSMGNAGTAVSGFLTPQFASMYDRQGAYLIVAGALLLVGLAIAFWGKNPPNWVRPAKGHALESLKTVARQRTTWDLSLIYAVSFGAFVAFGVYLPVLLKTLYGLSLADAAARAGGFVLLATIARPLGGWLSDKFGGKIVVRVALVLTTLLAFLVAFQIDMSVTTTVAYLSLALVLGTCNGAVIALVSKLSKPENVGGVTGIVGACGGLGGFVPPLILGITYQTSQSYAPAFFMLSVTAFLVFLYINHRFKDASMYKEQRV
jgi:NNP family nitrate/nitrite transporter-like MFS transporter